MGRVKLYGKLFLCLGRVVVVDDLVLWLPFYSVRYEVNLTFIALGTCFLLSCKTSNFLTCPLFINLYS